MQQLSYRQDYSNRPELGTGACEAQIEPRVNPSGVHVWPSNSSRPIDFLFYGREGHHQVPIDGGEYFEVLYLCSGSAICHVQGRIFPFEEGDLVVTSTTVL